jgi:hypothetical protein
VVSSVERALYIIDSETDEVIEKISDLPENPEEIAITPNQKKMCILHRSSALDQNSQMTIIHLEKQWVYTTYTDWGQELRDELQQTEMTKELMKEYWKKLWSKKYKQEYVEVGKDPRAIAVKEIEGPDGKTYKPEFGLRTID